MNSVKESNLTKEMIRMRRAGYPLGSIAERYGKSRQVVYQRIKLAAPELITGKRAEPVADNGKLQQVVSHAKFSPPATGSASGFIRPISLARLMGGRA